MTPARERAGERRTTRWNVDRGRPILGEPQEGWGSKVGLGLALTHRRFCVSAGDASQRAATLRVDPEQSRRLVGPTNTKGAVDMQDAPKEVPILKAGIPVGDVRDWRGLNTGEGGGYCRLILGHRGLPGSCPQASLQASLLSRAGGFASRPAGRRVS